MDGFISALSPQVLIGVGFLLAAMVLGYLIISWEQQKNDAPHDAVINADDYFSKAGDENLDDKFKEYLEEEQILEESPDIMSGQTERYEWQQNAREVDVYIPLDEAAKSKDISCKITPSTLTVSVRGAVVVQGSLSSEVVPSECNWQIESGSSNGERKIWVSLYKVIPSVKGRFWRRVLHGDEDLNPELNKTPVYNINTTDASSLKSAIEMVRDNRNH